MPEKCRCHFVEKDEPASIQILRHLRPHDMGFPALSVVTADTVLESVKTLLQFNRIIMPAVKLHCIEEADSLRVDLELVADFEDSKPVITELTLGALRAFSEQSLGDGVSMKLCFSHAPTYNASIQDAVDLYQNFFNCTVEFNAHWSGIELPTCILGERLTTRNKELYGCVKRKAEKELAHTNDNGLSYVEIVRSVLHENAYKGQYLCIEELAAELHLTPRTLSRKLANQNISYKDLMNEIRFEKAKAFLSNTDLPLKALANKFGFSSCDTFRRSFKKYTGITPTE